MQNHNFGAIFALPQCNDPAQEDAVLKFHYQLELHLRLWWSAESSRLYYRVRRAIATIHTRTRASSCLVLLRNDPETIGKTNRRKLIRLPGSLGHSLSQSVIVGSGV